MRSRTLSILNILLIICFFTPALSGAEENGVADVGHQSAPVPGAMVFTGAATYSIPISVLPGRKNLAPSLSLSYNSFSGNGWIGLGWNLGMPAIQRESKRGIDYTADKFMAGSDDLVPWPQWGEGYYRTKIERAFSKYYYDAAANTWTVTSKDGTQFFYGASSGSRLGKDENNTFIWMLERVEDTNNNYFIVHYLEDAGQLYLSSIEYTGHDYNNGSPGLAPSNEVIFELEDRPDPLVSYSIGKKITTAKRLKAIKIFNKDDDLSGAYNLIYEDDSPVNLSRLKKVQRIGSDNETQMPPVELTWNDGGLVSFQDYQSTNTPGSTAPGYVRFADLNGDGKDDIIRHDSIGVIYTALGLGDGTFDTFNTIHGPGGQGAGYVSLADINADGKVDLIKYDSSGNVYYAFSQGDGLFSNFSVHTGIGANEEWLLQISDVNGDGAGDLIRSVRTLRPLPPRPLGGAICLNCVDPLPLDYTSNYVYLFDKETNQFSDSYTVVGGDERGGTGQDFFFDINGDSYPDLIKLDSPDQTSWPDGNTLYVYLGNGQDGFNTTASGSFYAPDLGKGHTRFTDVNADGRTDLITHNQDGTVYVYLNNGNGSFVNTPVTHTGPGGNGANLVQVRDINNDGYADLIKESLDGTVYIYLARGGDGSFETNAFSQSKAASSIRLGVMFNDINGDGVLDIVRTSDNGAIYSYPAAGFGSPSLLKTARIQNAASISMDYTPSTQFEHTLMPNKMFLVTSRTINDGLGNASTETYEYSQGFYDFEEKAFMGFGHVKKTNPDFSVSKTWFHQDKLFKGMAKESQSFSPNEERLLTKTIPTYESVNLDESEDPVIFVKMTRTRTETYDNPTVFTQKDIVYDDTSGNPVSTTLSGTGAESLLTQMEYELIDNRIWRKTKETLTGITAQDGENTYPGTGKVREQYFTYYQTNGNLESESAWLASDSDPDATTPSVFYGYDTYGNQTSVTDAMGRTSVIEYDADTHTFPVRAQKPSTIAPDGTTTIEHMVSTVYNYLYAKPESVTDENGRTTTYVYDVFGRTLQTHLPDGGQSATQYYDFTIPRYTVSLVKENEQAGLVIVGYSFSDGLGRPIQSATMGENQYIISKKSYDNMGRAYRTDGPFFSAEASWPQQPPATAPWTITHYDEDFGRAIAMETPGTGSQGETTISQISYSGLTTTVTDPDGSRKIETKDYLGRVKEVIQVTPMEDIHTSYHYNAAKDLLQTINHYGKITNLFYDTLGRKTSMQDPDMGSWEYTYNNSGNLVSQKDNKGQVVVFTYDALDRVTRKQSFTDETLTQTSGDDTIYQYDNPNISNGIGRLYTVIKGDTQTLYDAYDVMGRDLSITKIINTDPYTTQKEYDLTGKMTKLTYPDGYYVEYEYRPGTGLLYNVTASDGFIQAWFEEYEPTGKIGAIDFGNGASTTYTYDDATTRLLSIETKDADMQSILDKSYTYSKAGDILAIDDNINAINHVYKYDALHRLISERIADQGIPVADVSVMDYQYQQKASDPYHGVSSITHNGQEITYQYDANGNMITSPDILDPDQTARIITYNADNMPIRIVKGSTVVDFTYDGHGTRVAKTVNNSLTTHYIGSHYETKNGSPVHYVFAGNLRIAMVKNTIPSYFHKDHLGSSTVLTNESGRVPPSQSVVYMPYGSIRGTNDITDSPYKFTDQEFDEETGLYNYNARLYDPVTGMFISADTIVPDPLNPQTFNRYSYCYNNPLMYVDPSGHFSFKRFFKSFIPTFIGGIVTGITGQPWLGGMIAGAISGAINGGDFKQIVKSAVIGGLAAHAQLGLYKQFGDIANYAVAGVGAVSSVAQDGLDGLADFGASFAGGTIGYVTGCGIKAAYQLNKIKNSYPFLEQDQSGARDAYKVKQKINYTRDQNGNINIDSQFSSEKTTIYPNSKPTEINIEVNVTISTDEIPNMKTILTNEFKALGVKTTIQANGEVTVPIAINWGNPYPLPSIGVNLIYNLKEGISFSNFEINW